MAQGLISKDSCRMLMLDWDGTMIERSSLELIAGINKDPSTPPFQLLSEAWNRDMREHEATHANLRRIVDRPFHYINSFGPVEEASFRRMEDTGLWRGVSGPQIMVDGEVRGQESPLNDVDRHAVETVQSGRLKLRDGAFDLCYQALQNQTKVYVISASWSASWIAACLREFGLPAASYFSPGASANAPDPRILVLANEIDPQGSGCLTRLEYFRNFDDKIEASLTFQPTNDGIWTSNHKGGLKFVLEQQQDSEDVKTIYIGDSVNDLLCLQTAHVGINIIDKEPTSEQQALEETLQQLHISGVHIDSHSRYDGRPWRLVSSGDFTHIWKYIKTS